MIASYNGIVEMFMEFRIVITYCTNKKKSVSCRAWPILNAISWFESRRFSVCALAGVFVGEI